MRGSHKFWLLIFIFITIYINYLSWFTNFIPRGDVYLTGLQMFVVIITFLLDFCAICIFVISFFTTLLPKFNNWLDEKF